MLAPRFTSIYQQAGARSGATKKELGQSNFLAQRRAPTLFAPGIITPWPHTALYAYVNSFK
jgi:hypothetical protein